MIRGPNARMWWCDEAAGWSAASMSGRAAGKTLASFGTIRTFHGTRLMVGMWRTLWSASTDPLLTVVAHMRTQQRLRWALESFEATGTVEV